MNCNNYESQFSDYLDGLLDQAVGDELRFHLKGCSRCRIKVEEMEQSINAVRSLPSMALRSDFDQALRSRLHETRTRELYAVPFIVRLKETCSELFQFSRQRSTQMVFATSLLFTIALIGGFSSWKTGSPQLAISIPAPVEHELAAWGIISPVPIESELAPAMAITRVADMVSEQAISDTPVSILTNSVGESPKPANYNAVMTIPTMESQAVTEIQTASTTSRESLDAAPLTSDRTINLAGSRQRDTNAFMIGGMPLNNSRVQAMRRLTRPASQIKRIRISF